MSPGCRGENMIDRLRGTFAALQDALVVSSSKEQIYQLVERFSVQNGFTWFAYILVDETNVRGISNYPDDWQKHYLQNRLFLVDPVIAKAKSTTTPFVWSGAMQPVGATKEARKFMREAVSIGIRSGITIPLSCGFGGKGAVTFSGQDDNIDREILLDETLLRYIGAFLHLYFSQTRGLFLNATDCPLSVLHLQCLSWLAKGKSSADIATMRGTSTRAVEYNLQLIRQKLSAVTTVQAVAIAVERQWIRP